MLKHGQPYYRPIAPKPAAPPVEEDVLLDEIRGLIFHFDGVLFDPRRLSFRIAAEYPPEALRVRIERRILNQFAGNDYDNPGDYYHAFFTAFGAACKMPPERLRLWYCCRYLPRVNAVLRKYYHLRSGVRELFARFKAPLPKGRVTWRPRVAVYSERPFLREQLAALDFYPGFKVFLYGADSFSARAYSPGPLLRIAREMNIPPHELLVVGERGDLDGLPARAAGMHFFQIDTGRDESTRGDSVPAPALPVLLPSANPLVIRRGRWEELTALIHQRMERR